MIHLMINMHETSIHIWQRLYLVLEVLRNIVCLPQRHLRREDDVNFDEIARTGVVNSTGVDLEDLGAECHCLRLINDDPKWASG